MMNFIIKNTVVVFMILLISHMLHAQDSNGRKYILEGDTLPDHTLTELVNYPNKSLSFKNFRGKWLILDFWAHGCSSCIASYPRMDTLSRTFRDKGVEVIMVGVLKTSESNGSRLGPRTRNTYRMIDRKNKPKVTTAFDSVLYMKYDLEAVPYILIVDPNGVVRAKTYHIDSAQVRQLLDGKMPVFAPAYARSEPRAYQKYNYTLPLLTSGKTANGGVDTSYAFRSMIVPANEAMPLEKGQDLTNPIVFKDAIKTGTFEIYHCSIAQFYRIAYFGKPFWSMMDSIDYQNNYYNVINESVELKDFDLKNEYSYSLTVPKDATLEFIQKSLLQDLERYFGFKSRLEIRNIPLYLLKKIDWVKIKRILKVDNGDLVNSIPVDGIWKIRNMPFRGFLSEINPGKDANIPIMNLSGISQKQKVSLDFPSDFSNYSELPKKLKLTGFSLEKSEKEMKVIVLK